MARCRLTFMQVSVNFVRTVLAVDTLIRLMEKPFSAEDLLHICIVVLPKESGNPFYEGNHYLCLRNPNQPQMRSSGLGMDNLWSFPRQESRDVVTRILYEPIYRHTIPHRSAKLGKDEREDITSSSWSYTSLDSFDDDEEEGKEVVSQLVLNRRRVRGVEIIGSSSVEVDIMRFKNLKKKTTPAVNPPVAVSLVSSRQVTAADSARDHDTSVALVRAVMLPTLSKETSEIMRKPPKSSGHLGPYGKAIGRVAEDQEEAQDKTAIVEAAFVELQACGPVYERVFNRGSIGQGTTTVNKSSRGVLACLSKLNIPEDNPTWAKVAPVPKFLESPMPYSPMILPDFDEEEYVNRPEEEEDVPDSVVALGDEAAYLAKGADGIATEGFGEKFAEEAGENAA
ncbi:hypothetical protein Acr_00g0068260 [Actinidia rufa]|uniref:Uncharacterized protein n=1 Tax=Actinidia rufa TaxID=165716 RepID=A0A7J0DQV9_9ERIC|nr:hypothetical protein Acr_00g0068260 [Actinidia rufa]